MYLWRAVDREGEILDVLVWSRRDKAAALRLMRKLLKKQGSAPGVLVSDKLGSYGAACDELGLSAHHVQELRKNNRAKNSHQLSGLRLTEEPLEDPLGRRACEAVACALVFASP